MAITREIYYTKDNTQDISLWTKVTEAEASLSKLISSIPGGTYYIRSRTTDGTNFSDYTTEDSQIVAAPALATPVLNAPTVVSSSQIDLSWADVANESQYELQSSTDNAIWTTEATLAADTVSYSDTMLTDSTTYYYRLRAVGDGTIYATSAWSTVVSATTGVSAPTVTADDQENTLDATHASGDSVIYVSENGGAYVLFTNAAGYEADIGKIYVGDVARAIGYYKFKAIVSGTESTVVDSPAFTVNPNMYYEHHTSAQNLTFANPLDFKTPLNQAFTIMVRHRLFTLDAKFGMGIFGPAGKRFYIANYYHSPNNSFAAELTMFSDAEASNITRSVIAGTESDSIVWIFEYDGSGSSGGIKIYKDDTAPSLVGSATNTISTLNEVGELRIGNFSDTFQTTQCHIDKAFFLPRLLTATERTEIQTKEAGKIDTLSFAAEITDGWDFDGNLRSLKNTHNGSATTPQFVS